jgi:hypothetical protein
MHACLRNLFGDYFAGCFAPTDLTQARSAQTDLLQTHVSARGQCAARLFRVRAAFLAEAERAAADRCLLV